MQNPLVIESNGEPWVVPDWPAVADQFDGVHLTMMGLLTFQGLPVATPLGATALLGWDSESTCWFIDPAVEWVPWTTESSHRRR